MFKPILLLSSAAILALATTGASAERVRMDRARDVDGVRAACAGVGLNDRAKERWDRYPVRFEVVGGYGQYLGGERITVHDRMGERISVRCQGPWVLMSLDPGRYHATVEMPRGPAKDIAFRVPQSGQHRVVVRFNDMMRGAERDTGYRTAER
ncbi:MAG: hypothetical protein JSR60_19435 [Proteobacteria bacterium]|nr:hypothetical protein [Pseudomonadota bacterium]